jgi:hypothetical protein
MQNFSKILKVLGLIALIALTGIGIGILGTRGSKPKPVSETNPPANESSHVTPIDTHPTKNPTPAAAPTNTAARPAEPAHTDMVAATPESTSTNWEDALEEILSSDSEDTNKVKQLYAMFPTLPPDGQEEVAQHLSNLVEDEDYPPLGKMLLDPKLPEDVLDVLMADLLNRPNSTKLPMFFDLAFTPDHPKAEEAKDLLELYLDEDYGTDQAKWKEAMDKWLKDPENQD